MSARVLIAEDEHDLPANLGLYLERREFEVELAADGREALERLRARAFDVAVLDVEMPARTGIELLADIRRESPETKVLLITADVARVAALLREPDVAPFSQSRSRSRGSRRRSRICSGSPRTRRELAAR